MGDCKMRVMVRRFSTLALAVAVTTLLVACDGGGSSGNGGIVTPPQPVPFPPTPTTPLPPAADNVLRVGPDQQFATTSLALAAAKDGYIIEVMAGIYENDPLCVRLNNLTIRAIGGIATFLATPPAGSNYPRTNPRCADKGIMVVSGNDVTIDGIEFTGAKVSSSNGAGIRAEGTNLTIRNSIFHKNQMGILANDNLQSTITIEDSEFYDTKGGPSIDVGHNIYINRIKKLVVTNISSHNGHMGHLLKTRARENHITASRFFDDEDGDSSFALDISGGVAFITGNYFQKGPLSENPSVMIQYDTSRDPDGPHEIYVKGNSFVSYLPTNGYWVRIRNSAPSAPPVTGQIEDNTFLAKYFANIGTNGAVFPSHYNIRPIPDLGTPPAPNVSIVAVNNTKLFTDDVPVPAAAAAPATPPLDGKEILCSVFSTESCAETGNNN